MAQAKLLKRGLLLEYITLGWNIIGVGIVIGAAWVANSVALAGFGLDSLIEIFASVVVVWQLRNINKTLEKTALHLIGAAFFGLIVYIAVQTVITLLNQSHAQTSPVGLVWLGTTLLVMLGLAWGKHHIGQQLGNLVLQTEGRVTLVDAYLAGAVLLGLALNAAFGWWWADPLAGLVIIFYGAREGWHAWQE